MLFYIYGVIWWRGIGGQVILKTRLQEKHTQLSHQTREDLISVLPKASKKSSSAALKGTQKTLRALSVRALYLTVKGLLSEWATMTGQALCMGVCSHRSADSQSKRLKSQKLWPTQSTITVYLDYFICTVLYCCLCASVHS